MADKKDYIGDDLKYLVVPEAGGFDPQLDDFEIEVISGSKHKTYAKSDLLDDGEGGFYLAIDTTGFKKGDLWAVVKMYVPDDDFPDGNRLEMVKQKLTTLWDVRK